MQRKLTIEQVAAIVAGVSYKDWRFHTCIEGSRDNPSFYLVVEFDEICIVSGERTVQRGRKWIISPYATDSEIVQTCFLAVKTAEEHELREKFKWEGQLVFGPHFDVRELHAIASAGHTDVREPLQAPSPA